MATTAIAIFVKTPGLSPLKTRLATGIGADQALEFYDLCLAVLRDMLVDYPATIFWAVGEEEGLSDPLWSSFNRLYTGDGDLGARQSHVYSTLKEKYDQVILMGADTPQITPDIITRALGYLADHDYVIGPANDGGYYLFAGRTPLLPSVWSNIPWSVSSTRLDLLNALPSRAFVTPDSLTDVDTKPDLAAVLREMPMPMTQAQDKLCQWIQELLDE